MYGISTLKTRREVTAAGVACPVRGCLHLVPPQPGVLRLTPEFKCPLHKVYISESALAYEKETDNLLWTDRASLELLRAVRGERPAPWLGVETSDDALLWNVFRWFDMNRLLPGLLQRWSGRAGLDGRPVYWGYDPVRERLFDSLRHGRSLFTEPEDDLTEPGLLVATPDTLFMVAGRAFASGPRRRQPPGYGPARWQSYAEGGEGWARRVLKAPCPDLTSDPGAFELLRLWLIGTWMATDQERDFVLIYVTPRVWGEAALGRLLPRLRGHAEHLVVHAHWEDVYDHVSADHLEAPDARALLSYLAEKSAGYDRGGRLRRALSLAAEASDQPATAAPILQAS